MSLAPREWQSLAEAVEGPVLAPSHPDYEAELSPFNLSTRHTPELVVAALHAEDVAHTVRWAADRGLCVAVQATGHGAVASFDRGIVVSTRRMQTLDIDPQTRLARIGAGVKWRAVIDRAASHGLAPLNGSSSDVGAVGYTVGGGLPVLGRTFGFASDWVRGFEVVTADGRIRAVSEHEHPDLFFALRGGKANIGIVTSMSMELVSVSTIYGGCMYFEGAHAQRLLEAYREWTRSLPESITTALKLLRLPPMAEVPEPLRAKVTVQLVVAHVGDLAEGEKLVRSMREVAPAIFDEVRQMPYSEVDAIHHDPEHPIPVKETCALLNDLTRDSVEGILSVAGPNVNSPLLMVELRHLGGALGRRPQVPDSVGARDAAYSVFLLGVLVPPLADLVPDALAAAVATLSSHTTGHTFVNMHGTPSSLEDRARPWANDVYKQLVRIKREVDPGDVFRFGHSLSELAPAS